MSAERRVEALGLTLPEPPRPLAAYVPSVRAGDLLFVSGVIPVRAGQPVCRGVVGGEVSGEEGYEAARVAVLNALAVIRHAAGSLDRVRRIVRMTGYVASREGFVDQPAVINGASDVLVEIFGEAGRHARVAVGVAALPMGVPVELELIVQLLPEDSQAR